jgi:hypothetical protein
MTAKSLVGLEAIKLTILPLLVIHTGWTLPLHICFLSLFISTKSCILFCTTIVGQTQQVLTVVGALQLLCILMTNQDAEYQPI